MLSDLAEQGELLEISAPHARTAVAVVGLITIVAFDEAHALATARLRMRTKALGLRSPIARVWRSVGFGGFQF